MHYRYLAASAVLGIMLALSQPLVDSAHFTAGAQPSPICGTYLAATQVSDLEETHESDDAEPFDLLFIDEMIAHNASAIAIANVALQQAQDSQIRRLALRVVESQAGEIQFLRHWRETWYSDAEQTHFPSAEPESHTFVETDIGPNVATLCAAGNEFDRVFLEMMIAHHQSAISIAEIALDNAQHDEIVAFAKSVIQVQGDEVAMMKRWLEEMTNSAFLSD